MAVEALEKAVGAAGVVAAAAAVETEVVEVAGQGRLKYLIGKQTHVILESCLNCGRKCVHH